MLAPIELLGPIANYIYVRYISGDKVVEASQEERYSKDAPQKLAQLNEYRQQKNAFWPRVEEVKNEWVWYIVAAGVAGVTVERGLRALLH